MEAAELVKAVAELRGRLDAIQQQIHKMANLFLVVREETSQALEGLKRVEEQLAAISVILRGKP